MRKIIFHVCNPKTEEWYDIDDRYQMWTCMCKEPEKVSLCLTINENLAEEGEYNEIRRKVAQKRKELGLLETITPEDIEKILENHKK